MSYKLVPPQGLYNSDIPNIVRPFTAKRILQDEFTFPRTTIFGLRDYVSAFGNKEVQQQKLIRDIENGRVILLAMSSEFGTLGTNCTGTGQGEFDSAIVRIKRSAKDRPLCGYIPESDSAFLELAAGAYMGFMSAVAEEAKETVEVVSDLVGSTIYEHTGYKGAEAAHKRTEKRVDNLIEELKHIDDLVEGVAHAILHPVDTAATIGTNVKKGYDTVSDKLAKGDNYGATFLLGTTAKQAADLLLDSPLENLKKLKKAKKVVKAIDPSNGVYRKNPKMAKVGECVDDPGKAIKLFERVDSRTYKHKKTGLIYQKSRTKHYGTTETVEWKISLKSGQAPHPKHKITMVQGRVIKYEK